MKPVALPAAVPQTQAAGLGGFIETTNANQKTAAETERARREAEQAKDKNTLNATLRDIMSSNTDIASAGSTIDRTDQNKARKEADRLTSEIEAEQLSNRRRIEALQKNNPKGLFGGALEDEVNRINRESVSKQADLAILQNSALRNYETARSIADKQLELKLEPLKANLENLKFFYEQNKADFDKEDDRLYSELIMKEDAELKKQTELEGKIMEAKLLAAEKNAPASVLAAMGRAKSFDELLQAGAGWFGDATDSDIKTQVVELPDKTKVLINSETGETIKTLGRDASAGQNESAVAIAKDTVAQLDGLLNHRGLAGAVGANRIARSSPDFNFFTGVRDDFIAGVAQITSQLTLDKLIQSKASGATFGALSDGEREVLAGAATKLNTFAIKDENGKVIGYKASEKVFKEELAKIKMLTERDIEKRQKLLEGAGGGTPTPDGQRWEYDEEGNLQSVSTNASASRIASAIRQVESQGNYNAKGASGESGAYQFMPSTWRQWAGQFLGDPNAPMTPANQDKVALAKVQSLLDQGYNAKEISLIWNGGEPKVKKGVNSKGVAYDSGAYAAKVLAALS